MPASPSRQDEDPVDVGVAADFDRAAADEDMGSSTQTASMVLPPLAGRRVLLLDDNVELREMLAAVLEEAGLSVVETGCRRAALVHVAGRTLDAMVVDLVMPEQNGIDFLRNVRGNVRGAGVPALLLNSLPKGGTREAARLAVERMAPAVFVDKPVTPRVLLHNLEVLLSPR